MEVIANYLLTTKLHRIAQSFTELFTELSIYKI
jgi:hypothetical protein